jgi:hypothetical protein
MAFITTATSSSTVSGADIASSSRQRIAEQERQRQIAIQQQQRQAEAEQDRARLEALQQQLPKDVEAQAQFERTFQRQFDALIRERNVYMDWYSSLRMGSWSPEARQAAIAEKEAFMQKNISQVSALEKQRAELSGKVQAESSEIYGIVEKYYTPEAYGGKTLAQIKSDIGSSYGNYIGSIQNYEAQLSNIRAANQAYAQNVAAAIGGKAYGSQVKIGNVYYNPLGQSVQAMMKPVETYSVADIGISKGMADKIKNEMGGKVEIWKQQESVPEPVATEGKIYIESQPGMSMQQMLEIYNVPKEEARSFLSQVEKSQPGQTYKVYKEGETFKLEAQPYHPLEYSNVGSLASQFPLGMEKVEYGDTAAFMRNIQREGENILAGIAMATPVALAGGFVNLGQQLMVKNPLEVGSEVVQGITRSFKTDPLATAVSFAAGQAFYGRGGLFRGGEKVPVIKPSATIYSADVTMTDLTKGVADVTTVSKAADQTIISNIKGNVIISKTGELRWASKGIFIESFEALKPRSDLAKVAKFINPEFESAVFQTAKGTFMINTLGESVKISSIESLGINYPTLLGKAESTLWTSQEAAKVSSLITSEKMIQENVAGKILAKGLIDYPEMKDFIRKDIYKTTGFDVRTLDIINRPKLSNIIGKNVVQEIMPGKNLNIVSGKVTTYVPDLSAIYKPEVIPKMERPPLWFEKPFETGVSEAGLTQAIKTGVSEVAKPKPFLPTQMKIGAVTQNVEAAVRASASITEQKMIAAPIEMIKPISMPFSIQEQKLLLKSITGLKQQQKTISEEIPVSMTKLDLGYRTGLKELQTLLQTQAQTLLQTQAQMQETQLQEIQIEEVPTPPVITPAVPVIEVPRIRPPPFRFNPPEFQYLKRRKKQKRKIKELYAERTYPIMSAKKMLKELLG